MKIGSKDAPGCAFKHGEVSMLALKPGGCLNMVFIIFWTLQPELEIGAAKVERKPAGERGLLVCRRV